MEPKRVISVAAVRRALKKASKRCKKLCVHKHYKRFDEPPPPVSDLYPAPFLFTFTSPGQPPPSSLEFLSNPRTLLNPSRVNRVIRDSEELASCSLLGFFLGASTIGGGRSEKPSERVLDVPRFRFRSDSESRCDEREKSSDPRGRFDEAGNDSADTMKLRRTSFLDFIFILSTFFCGSHALHRRLTKRELVETFGVEKHSDVPEYSLLRVTERYSNASDGSLRLSFDAWNTSYTLALKPNYRIIGKHLTTVVRHGNASSTRSGIPAGLDYSCHYQGKVLSHEGRAVAVSDCRHLMGTIVMEDHFLVLQTIPKRVRHHQKEDHLVFKRDASLLTSLERAIEEHFVDMNEDQHVEFCEVSKSVDDPDIKAAADILAPNYTLPSVAKLDSLFIFPQLDPITLEIGLFLDSKLFEHFQREFQRDAEQHLLDFSLALINNVHVLYQQPTMNPNLDIVIVRYELWKSQPAGLETGVHKNGQAQTLLDGFCRHQARINPGSDLTDPGHWDHGVLLTGYDIYHTTTSVAGVAPVARMCDELFACSLVEGLHLGRSLVLAHEMGHNMGMVHDGVQNQCSRSCCLMSAVNGAGKTTWSTCSVREFNAFLLQLDQSGRGNCLRDAAESISTHDHLKDGRLPGQRFTADQQCSYFWGKEYQVEIPNGRRMDDICRILWCGNSGSTISTAHPALEGTWCGGAKWCQEGKCQPWLFGEEPRVVNGAWSLWGSNDKRCPISSCQVTGSIQLKPEMRTCTEPAPNNGGQHCRGTNIRGLVCGAPESGCRAFTRQEFGDKLCSAIKNDPEKPDLQLSGSSFLHSTQPCKVWCHLQGSELIRNKGQFPNGSPCGPNQYCVGGHCLNLACDDRAVVADSADCPEAGKDDEEMMVKWDLWTEWSSCSASCGTGGVQRRSRKCLTHLDSCLGKGDETRPCKPEPPKCEQYSDWSEWSVCSAACGEGQQTRKRICMSGVDCKEKLLEEKPCNKGPCPTWSAWETWSPCSATCGDGHKSRRRTCSIEGQCEGEATLVFPCNERECVVETWSEWMSCSVTCGIGFQLREKLCDGEPCPNASKQARTCNLQDCSKASSPNWDDWTEWSSCSRTCGEGIQSRTRQCLSFFCSPLEPDNEARRCVAGPCPSSWGEWSEWSPCSSCAPGETRRRHRSCEVEEEDACVGATTEIDSCDALCNRVNGVANLKTAPIGIERWNPWQEWLPCSASCGGGIRQRLRTCPDGASCSEDGLSFELDTCNAESCETLKKTVHYWSEWGEWEQCSASCGGGRQTRSRKCLAQFVFLCDGYVNEERPCATEPCPDVQVAATHSVPAWSEWSDWSECSCFTLNQFRRRYCQIRDPAIQGFCAGPTVDQRSCTPTACLSQSGGWSEWSGWSKCSKDCGVSGHQIRNRMCSNPLPSNRGSYCIGYSFDQKPCAPQRSTCSGPPVDGAWSQWTDWSTCSDPCSNGHRSRTRYCNSPRPANGGLQCLGGDFEMQPCSDSSQCTQSRNGEWGVWSSWSQCSAACGFAFQSRHRFCDSPAPSGDGDACFGLAYMTSICRTDACESSVDGQWSSWGAWSQCAANCGIGSRTRTRECSAPAPINNGFPCFGRSSEVEDCTVDVDASERICSTSIANMKLLESDMSLLTLR
ncbi:hypothetical protein QR680_016824 [Steinernema hermaphroditum]|uniref:Peptidase M12B domain-containing protein n=1 Tax=Steinernema hermaphroditum TaxID=289476 RepID=A0AA39HCE2_9BILA|nr:hypothetical protein QR680_016824 [Steinernema hermaphroditum]